MLKGLMAAGAAAMAIGTSAFAGTNSWTALGPDGGDVREVALHPVDPNRAVAIAHSGFYRTTNGGLSWAKSPQPFQNPPYDLQVDPSDPDRIYVFGAGPTHIIVSSDGGTNFEPLANSPVTNAYEPRLGLAPGGVMYYAAGLRIFRSDDRGSSWSERTAILLSGAARIGSILVDPTNSNRLYVVAVADGQSGAAFVSDDAGSSWRQLSGTAAHAVPHPTNPGELWSPRFDGLWRSMNFGDTWSHIQFTDPVYDIAVNPRGNDLHLVVVTAFGVHRSTNGGSTWSDITGDLQPYRSRVATHPIDATRIMVSGYAGISAPGSVPGTWVTRHGGLVASSVGAFEADATTDRIHALANGSSIHVRSASGEFAAANNRQLGTIGSPPMPKLLTAIHAQPGNLLALITDELARSSDGGQSWELIPGFIGSQPYHQRWQVESAAAEPRNLIVSGYPDAFRSSDGGLTWTRITAGLPPDFTAFDFEFAASNPSIVYLSPYISGMPNPQYFGVYRSTDGGSNWVPANSGIDAAAVTDIEVDPTNAQVVYAIAGTTFVKSVDGGTTWRTLRHSVSYQSKVAIDPLRPRIVYLVYGDNHVLRSVNGGESFETIRDLATMPWWYPGDVIVDPRRTNIVNVGTRGFGAQQITIEPDLSLAWGVAPSSASIGNAAAYSVFATNRGPYASSGARVTIQLPAAVTDPSASTQGGTCSVSQTRVDCVVDSMPVNGSIGISLSLRAQATGAFAVSATVEGDQPDSNGSNNAITHSINVSDGSAPTPPPQGPMQQTPSQGGASGGGGGGSISIALLLASLLLYVARIKSPWGSTIRG